MIKKDKYGFTVSDTDGEELVVVVACWLRSRHMVTGPGPVIIKDTAGNKLCISLRKGEEMPLPGGMVTLKFSSRQAIDWRIKIEGGKQNDNQDKSGGRDDTGALPGQAV